MRVDTVPDPKIERPTDAIIQVTSRNEIFQKKRDGAFTTLLQP